MVAVCRISSEDQSAFERGLGPRKLGGRFGRVAAPPAD